MTQDPSRREEWRRARRAAVRAHHPDAGGDAEALDRALADVDRRFAAPAAATAPPPARGLRRRGRLLVRRLRSRLPRWVPGARRYTDL